MNVQFQDISTHTEGKEIILMSDTDTGDAISTAAQTYYNDEGFILAKVASIIRRYIFDD